MISIYLTLLLATVILICFLVRLFNGHLTKKQDIIICIVLPVLSLSVFISVFAENRRRRNLSDEQLSFILEAIEYNDKGYRLFTTNQERILFIDSLNYYIHVLDTLAYNDSIASIIVGKDQEHSQRIVQAKRLLSLQQKRYSRLNSFADTSYIYREEENSDNIKLIEPDNFVLPTLNIAFRLRHPEDSIKAVYLEFNRGDSIVYSQTYIPQPKINCFIMPNLFSDTTVLKMGYIAGNNDALTFYRIIYTPYE